MVSLSQRRHCAGGRSRSSSASEVRSGEGGGGGANYTHGEGEFRTVTSSHVKISYKESEEIISIFVRILTIFFSSFDNYSTKKFKKIRAEFAGHSRKKSTKSFLFEDYSEFPLWFFSNSLWSCEPVCSHDLPVPPCIKYICGENVCPGFT